MSEGSTLIDALKRALKNHGLTYGDVARNLGLSEASVKRMFSTGNFTIDRLGRICALMELGLSDLVRMMEEDRHRISRLSHAQEEELISDTRLLLVAVCARNHWAFDDIIAHYALSETECVRYLARLDRLGIIELLPRNRIKLRVAADFRWIPRGPIERFFQDQVQNEFFHSEFDAEDELRLFLNGSLSRGSRELLLRRLHRLAKEFAELHNEDCALPLAERQNVGLVLALRPLEFSAFQQLRRPT